MTKNFLQYLYEANSYGSSFESYVAANVQRWIVLTKQSARFSAKRYQTISEDLGNRDEDYSDIVVEDRKQHSKFFIECKKNQRDNIINIQFDIVDGCKLVPVKTIARTESKSPHLKRLAADIEKTDEWKRFREFMTSKISGIRPIDIWLQSQNMSDKMLSAAISRYNKLVDSGKLQSNCQKFDAKTIRESTENQLLVALLWRLSDPDNTWDVCHLHDISYFGQLVKDHYMYGKAGDVKYIQLGNDCFRFADDPLKTTCKEFPADATGQFDLKFTPRFGVGGMYLTPRSKLTDKLSSNFTFAK